MYNHDDEVMIFTVPNRDSRTVDKCDMKPHYVLCSVGKRNLVLDYCAYDGWRSIFLQHWDSFTKILKEKNKKLALMEAKKEKYFKKYAKVNSAYKYRIRTFINICV